MMEYKLSARKQAEARIAAGRREREAAGVAAIARVAELEAVLRDIAKSDNEAPVREWARAKLPEHSAPEGEAVDAELTDEQFAALPVLRVCPHGKTAGECHDCDVAADFAFDAAREDRAFGRR